jgi:hypothetical protein
MALDDGGLQTLLTQPCSERWEGLAGTDNNGIVVLRQHIPPGWLLGGAARKIPRKLKIVSIGSQPSTLGV